MRVTEQKTYYPSLNGLRGLAILLILLTHLFEYVPVFKLNWISVDLFFVISGFLITEIILKKRGTTHFLQNFYIRRALRIFPLYYVSLFIILYLIPASIIGFSNLQYFRDNRFWLFFYVQNWLYILKNPDHNLLLNHFWTLAVEEQYYFFWPLCILFIKKTNRLLLFIGCIILLNLGWRMFMWHLSVPDISYAYLYKFTRIDGLCVGSGLAILWVYKRAFIQQYLLTICMIVAAANVFFILYKLFVAPSLPFHGFIGYLTASVFWGVVMYVSLIKKSKWLDSFLNFSPLQGLGNISYSLYIWHWPVYWLALPFLSKFLSARFNIKGLANDLIVSVACSLGSLLMALLTYYCIEKFFLKLKDKIAPIRSS